MGNNKIIVILNMIKIFFDIDHLCINPLYFKFNIG